MGALPYKVILMIFRYPGGKSKKSVKEKILSYFPKSYEEYREPMVGGGGIFFAIPLNKNRWINDIDCNLISVYQALKERPLEFIKKCREINKAESKDGLALTKESGNAFYNARLKEKFDYFAKNSEEDAALRYFFIHRTVWAGRVNYNMESRMYFSNPSGWNVAHSDKMEKASQIVRDAKITCTDFSEMLTTDGNNVVIYLDPPYYVNTEFNNTSKLYKYNFTKEDHERMCKLVKSTKHKVVISYDNHPYIKSLYSSFNLHCAEWTYCGTSSAEGQSNKKKKGQELIITNF